MSYNVSVKTLLSIFLTIVVSTTTITTTSTIATESSTTTTTAPSTTKIIGEYLCVPNPCTTDPCLPGMVLAVVSNSITYHLTVNGAWVWDCMDYSWDGYTPSWGDIVIVLGEVTEHTDINDKSFYDIEVESLRPNSCVIEELYGEHSKQAWCLRTLRDGILRPTPQGQEIIRLYYELSPVIVEMMNEDEVFKAQVKEMIEGFLEVIGGEER